MLSKNLIGYKAYEMLKKQDKHTFAKNIIILSKNFSSSKNLLTIRDMYVTCNIDNMKMESSNPSSKLVFIRFSIAICILKFSISARKNSFNAVNPADEQTILIENKIIVITKYIIAIGETFLVKFLFINSSHFY